MKSLAELAEIKAKTIDSIELPKDSEKKRIVVGMATCGISAGAKPVLETLKSEIEKAGIADKVTAIQTGCVGICQYEPVVEVFTAGEEKVTYVKMTAEKAKRVFDEHIVGGNIVTEYTIGYSNI